MSSRVKFLATSRFSDLISSLSNEQMYGTTLNSAAPFPIINIFNYHIFMNLIVASF